MLCYDACKYNIYMQHEQIRTRSVELTWIFAQAIFMAINTMLWSLSYAEIRAAHPKAEVEGHLQLAVQDIILAADRWPGIESARQLYDNLITACLHIYDKEGDLPVTEHSPFQTPSLSAHDISSSRSVTSTPANAANENNTTSPAQTTTAPSNQPGFGTAWSLTDMASMPGATHGSSLAYAPSLQSYTSYDSPYSQYTGPQFTPLPEYYDAHHWGSSALPLLEPLGYTPIMNMPYVPEMANVQYDSSFPEMWNPQGLPLDQAHEQGLTREQQAELMQNLEESGMGRLEMMIERTTAFFNPGSRPG